MLSLLLVLGDLSLNVLAKFALFPLCRSKTSYDLYRRRETAYAYNENEKKIDK